MLNAVRTLLICGLSALVCAGLIGCASYASASAVASVSPDADAMQMAGHDHHQTGHTGHHDPAKGEDCKDCAQSILQRVNLSPDTPALGDLPVRVFILPSALSLGAASADVPDPHWPPGAAPPRTPDTLTHQKISLLI